jgi:2-methylcitrate dehydratase PrpD
MGPYNTLTRTFASVALTHRMEAAEAAITLRVGHHIARRHTDTIAREIAGGAAVHTAGARPSTKSLSQENAIKSGFSLLYARAVWLKPGVKGAETREQRRRSAAR